MKCEDCLVLLDDYLDALLEGGDAAGVSEHLEGCPACASHQSKLLREREVYECYFLEAEAKPASWEKVRAQIRGEAAARTSTRVARLARWLPQTPGGFSLNFGGRAALAGLAAVLACAALLSWVSTGPPAGGHTEVGATASPGPDAGKRGHGPPLNNQGAEGSGPQISQTAPAPRVAVARTAATAGGRRRRAAVKYARRDRGAPPPEAVAAGALLPGEEGYVRAIGELTSEVAPALAKMPKGLRAEYLRNLKTVNRVIAEARRAARRHPENPHTVDFVMSAYRGKLTMLTSVANLSMAPDAKF